MSKKIELFILFTLLSCALSAAPALTLKDVKCNFRYDPSSVDGTAPLFSWKLASDKRNVMQTAYEIKVGTNKKDLSSGKNLVWSTGKIQSDQSANIPYQGEKLKSRQLYYWQVNVWDNQGNVSKSHIQEWQSGLAENDWTAKWIETSIQEDDEDVIYFRKQTNLNKQVLSARLYITSHGVYEVHVNGKPVDDQTLAPGWTTYQKRIQYQEYDIKDLLSTGSNTINVVVGEGWYKGVLLGVNHFYGDKVGLLAQLEISYKDGSKETIGTDQSWQTSKDGAILKSGLYSGEIYDARKAKTFGPAQDIHWKSAQLSETQSYKELIPSIAPPVKRQEVLKAMQIITTPKGEKVIDFGQNMTGRVRLSVKGEKGDSILISHAEVLDKEGNFYTDNLRGAKQQITYYLAGGIEETYEPILSFQGFRYIRIDGNKELIGLNNIEAVVLHSDLPQTGKFSTSNPLLNQLQHNILWGQKSNFLDIPTDCPQRDERFGWTGDAQVFFATASFNMDVSSFFSKWMADVRAEQLDNGGVSGIVPNVWGTGEGIIGQAGWGDAATIIPWQYFKAYGDKMMLEDSYHSMLRWADYIAGRSTGYLWNKNWHHGDWLHFMPQNVWDKAPAYTEKTIIAQAFYAYTLQNIIHSAEILGKEEDVRKYSSLLEKVKETFNREFVTPAGGIMSNTQTAYVLALQFDILPEDMRAQAAERLVELVHEYDDHLSTGFLGTPYLCHVLSRFGYQDLAYKLLLQESYPSWLYPVKMGATTIWERWDGIRPDGTFQDIAMNSFNHYAYGAIGNWMYKNIGGLDQRENSQGYKYITFAPKIGGNITHSDIELESVYGKVACSWKIEGKTMNMQVEVPPNSQAEVVFPAFCKGNIKESGKQINLSENQSALPIGSGKYLFSFDIE